MTEYKLPEPAIRAGVEISSRVITNEDYFTENQMHAIFNEGYVAGLAARVPEGRKIVEVSLLKRAADSLGSFCSDHGWSDADMDVLDSVIAQLPAAPEPK